MLDRCLLTLICLKRITHSLKKFRCFVQKLIGTRKSHALLWKTLGFWNNLEGKFQQKQSVYSLTLSHYMLYFFSRFQEFYEEGERELLLNEVCELRNQVFQNSDRR